MNCVIIGEKNAYWGETYKDLKYLDIREISINSHSSPIVQSSVKS